MDIKYIGSICAICVISFYQCYAQDLSSTLTVVSETNNPVESEGYVQSDTRVKFSCEYAEITPAAIEGGNVGENQVYMVELQRYNTVNNGWINEGECRITFGGTQPLESAASTMDIKNNHIACTNTLTEFSGLVSLSNNVKYRCRVRDALQSNTEQFSAEFTLNIYTIPTQPTINSDPRDLKEDGEVRFTCTSDANPRPQLQFKLGPNPMKISVVNDTDATSDQLLKQGSLVWDTIISKDAHGKELTCEVVNHMYPQARLSRRVLDVFYGPDPNVDYGERKVWKLHEGEPTVKCEFPDSNPALEYMWFRGQTRVQTGPQFTLQENIHYDPDELPYTVNFTCRGTNPKTTMTADKVFSIYIERGDGKPVTQPSSGTDETGGLKTWVIPVAIVVPLVVIILIVVIVCLCVRARRHREPEKAKDARRPSDDRHDKYMSSNASLSRGDTARTGNYHDNPTLPVEYRYSQHGAVESYAEVIDDMPRSRKPIALEDMEMFDDNNVPSVYNEAPPAYTTDPGYNTDPGYMDTGTYGGSRGGPAYSTYSPSYGSSYGAAC